MIALCSKLNGTMWVFVCVSKSVRATTQPVCIYKMKTTPGATDWQQATYAFRFATQTRGSWEIAHRRAMSTERTAQHRRRLNIEVLGEMVDSGKRNGSNRFLGLEPRRKSYSDSSRIFGKGICWNTMSSSKDSLVFVIAWAIIWAKVQHCTSSALPCSCATILFCLHISERARA